MVTKELKLVLKWKLSGLLIFCNCQCQVSRRPWHFGWQMSERMTMSVFLWILTKPLMPGMLLLKHSTHPSSHGWWQESTKWWALPAVDNNNSLCTATLARTLFPFSTSLVSKTLPRTASNSFASIMPMRACNITSTSWSSRQNKLSMPRRRLNGHP